MMFHGVPRNADPLQPLRYNTSTDSSRHVKRNQQSPLFTRLALTDVYTQGRKPIT